MVRLGSANPWIFGLLSVVGKIGIQAAESVVPGSFIIEFEDNIVSSHSGEVSASHIYGHFHKHCRHVLRLENQFHANPGKMNSWFQGEDAIAILTTVELTVL